ncbi:MAG TPA: Tad domain-containing protein [Candidatus Limnocylindria bacterium]|nr:Tad domain-containing protein [Candidatus Limnocylindria bacterium]
MTDWTSGTRRWLRSRRANVETGPAGQVLVIVAVGMIVMIALVGLVIDGGFAWGKQRENQNAADSVAKAGAVVVQHAYADDVPPTDGDVGCAVEASVDAFGVELVSAVYTDSAGTPLTPEIQVGDCGSAAAIPVGINAQGVKATTTESFDTFLARVVGFDTFTTTADATAVVGPQVGLCPAGSGCGVLPVTFPISAVKCDGTNSQIVVGSPEWEILDVDGEIADQPSVDNMSIIPLCSTEAGTETPGSVGWLDFGCGNLAETIEDPCNLFIPIPAWVKTETGNVNSVEDELNDYAGDQIGVPEFDESDPDRDQVAPLPIHTNTCESDPDGPLNDIVPPSPNPCPEGDWSGQGSNTYYLARYWVGFMLDQAYIQGSNVSECNSPPGSPSGVAGSGATSCLKGWFVDKFEAPGTIGIGDLSPGAPQPMGIVLVE